MGDAEGAVPLSKKRVAGRQLTKDNPDEDGPEPEMGTFQRASEEVLATRRMVKVRRHQPPSAPSSTNPFASIRLIPPSDSSQTTSANIEPQISGEKEVSDEQDGSREKQGNNGEDKGIETGALTNEPGGTGEVGTKLEGKTDVLEAEGDKLKDDAVEEVIQPVETAPKAENGRKDADEKAREEIDKVGGEGPEKEAGEEAEKMLMDKSNKEAKEEAGEEAEKTLTDKSKKEAEEEAGEEAEKTLTDKSKKEAEEEAREEAEKEAGEEAEKEAGEEAEKMLMDKSNKDASEETDKEKLQNDHKDKTEPVASVSSFRQLSSSQNAFTGLAGTGFSGTSFSFGSVSKEGSSFGASSGSPFGFKNENSSFASFGKGSSNNGTPSFSLFGTAATDGVKSGLSGIASMQEVTVETGEENEKSVFTADAILFEYLDGGWKERGKGELKVNITASGAEKSRLVMRARGNYRLILNASLYPDMSLKNMEKKGITFACINSAGEGKAGLATFALKFKDSSIVEEFREAVTTYKGKKTCGLKTPENSPKASDD